MSQTLCFGNAINCRFEPVKYQIRPSPVCQNLIVVFLSTWCIVLDNFIYNPTLKSWCCYRLLLSVSVGVWTNPEDAAVCSGLGYRLNLLHGQCQLGTNQFFLSPKGPVQPCTATWAPNYNSAKLSWMSRGWVELVPGRGFHYTTFPWCHFCPVFVGVRESSLFVVSLTVGLWTPSLPVIC